MTALDHRAFALLLAGFASLTISARLLGNLARRLGQPALLGELLAGGLLGVAALGRVAPEAHGALFPSTGPGAIVFKSSAEIALLCFMFVVGMELDVGLIWNRRRTSSLVSLAGIAVPFLSGYLVVILSGSYIAAGLPTDRTVLALFLATALSISALPVITKLLVDLQLLRTELGAVVVASAVFDDIAGWTLLGVVLSWANLTETSSHWLLLRTSLYVCLLMTLGRYAAHRSLGWLKQRRSEPGATLSLLAAFGLCNAAVAELIGIHAVFGAFLAGACVGNASPIDRQARAAIEQVATSLLGPFYFAYLLLRVDFVVNFDLLLCAILLLVACVGKVLGCSLAAVIGGTSPRTALAIGFMMNARGAMEILLGSIGLQAGIIDERLFVALVFMAVATSVMAGPAVRACAVAGDFATTPAPQVEVTPDRATREDSGAACLMDNGVARPSPVSTNTG